MRAELDVMDGATSMTAVQAGRAVPGTSANTGDLGEAIWDVTDAVLKATGAVGCCIMVDGCQDSAVAMGVCGGAPESLSSALRMYSCALLGQVIGTQAQPGPSSLSDLSRPSDLSGTSGSNADGTAVTGTAMSIQTRQIQCGGQRFEVKGLVLCASGDVRPAAVSLAFDEVTQPQGAMAEARLAMVVPLLQAALSMVLKSASKQGHMHRLERQCVSLRRALSADPVTGLLTAQAFHSQAEARILAGPDGLALILLDVYHLKNVEALFDRTFVDNYLEAVAAALSGMLPGDALVARLGGGEFAVLVPLAQSVTGALADLMARCRKAAQHGASAISRPDLGQVSLGVCTLPDKGDSLHILMGRAKAALRAARATGRNVAVTYELEHATRFGQGEIDGLFRHAADMGRIHPYFQPVVELSTGLCRGFEVLARWIAEDGRLLTPADFAEAFRDHRTAEALTDLMLDYGMEHFARWRRAAGPEAQQARLGVNLTAYDLTSPDFAERVRRMLQAHDLTWTSLMMEVTETVILGDPRGQAFRTLETLRALGAKVAMDDFGTGYGSFQHLRDWPIDTLKIDRTFVARLCDSARDRAVVEAVLGIAAGCGMEAVVEGVETDAQMDVLRHLGGVGPRTLAQGYLFAAPMSPDAMAKSPIHYHVPFGSPRLVPQPPARDREARDRPDRACHA